MYRLSRPTFRHAHCAALAAFGALGTLAACGRSDRVAGVPRDPPPRAEFLVAGTDSTYWVSTTDGHIRVRGEPIVLARYDGRWYEVYSVDDDRSYDDALLVGQRLYRRDLASGDSAMVFADTTVPRLADAYGRSHPDERPLSPDEDGEADPSEQATAELDILDVFGPYLSYEYRVEVSLPAHDAWRSTRRGVIDLRSGRAAAASALFGPAGSRVVAEGRRAFDAMRDSVARVAGALPREQRAAAAAIARQRFDDGSFSLTTVDGRPAVAFRVPGRGPGPEGNGLELDPLAVDVSAWSPEPASSRASTDSSGDDRWIGAGYRVIARYDTSGSVATLSIADSTRREWPLVSMGAPVHRIDWLDRPPVSAAERSALVRPFNAASTYGEPSQVAVLGGRNLQLAAHETHQGRSRQPSRDVRAHVAPARQQHGPRVRRRDSFDDGSVRGHLRVQAQPAGSRDRIHRSGRLSRADPPR